jgi:hypothetical protein
MHNTSNTQEACSLQIRATPSRPQMLMFVSMARMQHNSGAQGRGWG